MAAHHAVKDCKSAKKRLYIALDNGSQEEGATIYGERSKRRISQEQARNSPIVTISKF